MSGEDGDERLHLVHVRADDDPAPAMDELGAIALGDGLFVVRSDLTRSRLYHLVKRRTRPTALLVAPLAEAPKFLGMAPGALAALRRLSPP